VENTGLFKPAQVDILTVISSVLQSCRGAFMDATSQSAKWTSHEIKTAAMLYERRTEDLQLQQLRLRLQKKMREEADRTSASTAA
jgi:hypothetical protein